MRTFYSLEKLGKFCGYYGIEGTFRGTTAFKTPKAQLPCLHGHIL
jgi:hypothetical protein